MILLTEHEVFLKLRDRSTPEMRRKIDRAFSWLKHQSDATDNTVIIFERQFSSEMIDAESRQYETDIRLGLIDHFKVEGGKLNGTTIKLFSLFDDYFYRPIIPAQYVHSDIPTEVKLSVEKYKRVKRWDDYELRMFYIYRFVEKT